jgi:hypothetical protein
MAEEEATQEMTTKKRPGPPPSGNETRVMRLSFTPEEWAQLESRGDTAQSVIKRIVLKYLEV